MTDPRNGRLRVTSQRQDRHLHLILNIAIARDNFFTKIILPMLKLDTNSGFHELFLNSPPELYENG